MKLGIITFHFAHNYGAVLQTYALQSYLEECGHDVCVIDYRPKVLVDSYRVFNIKFILSSNPIKCLKKLFYTYPTTLKERLSRYKMFESYIKSTFSLVPINKLSDIDCFILGSDQIWNKKLTNGFDKIYWGAFKKRDNQRVISYAASMEIQKNITVEESNVIKGYLSQIESISVRENLLRSTLAPLSNKDIAVVLDPTLLIDREHWHKMAKCPTNAPKKYILLYMANDDVRRYAKIIGKEHDMEIVDLLVDAGQILTKNTFASQTPEEFVGWFKNASYILTTSFHGLAFSIIFEKSFNIISRAKSPNSRASDLLEALGALERLCEVGVSPKFETINYQVINTKLENLQSYSRKFIKEAISTR